MRFDGFYSLALTALAGPFLLASPVWAEDQSNPVEIVLKDHQYSPAEIHVTAGKPTYLRITNQDDTADEFEVRQLAIEKMIVPGGSVLVRLRPLGPGRYAFIADFHEDTGKGVIVAE